MKHIIGIIIAYWRVYLRWGTWNKTRKIRFFAKVDFEQSFFVNPENLLM